MRVGTAKSCLFYCGHLIAYLRRARAIVRLLVALVRAVRRLVTARALATLVRFAAIVQTSIWYQIMLRAEA